MHTIITYPDQEYILEMKRNYVRIVHDQYKYMITQAISIDISRYKNLLPLDIDHEYYSVKNGLMTAKSGYCWDGASGPTIDDETNMRASLFHDIGYQMMTEVESVKKLSFWKKIWIRRSWDKLFRRILKTDGMGFIRRSYYFISVRGVGALFAYF